MPRRSLTFRRWQVVSSFLIVCASFIIVGALLETSIAQIRKGRIEARLTICREINKVKRDQRADRAADIQVARKYLRQHPSGAPGILRTVMEESIANKQRRRLRLADVDCDYVAHFPNAPPRYLPVEPV